MNRVVIYGVGSPIVPDVQESLARAGVEVAAAVRNLDGKSWLLESVAEIMPSELTPELLALPFLAPFFTPGNRQSVVAEALAGGFRDGYSLIDPTVPPCRSLAHGAGLYLNSGCTTGALGELGDWVFVNRGASLGHHVRIGDFVSIGPGAVVSAFVSIGRGSVVGAGAVVLPELSIGSNSVIGAGAVVTKNVADHCQVLGNPARVSQTGIAGYKGRSVE